MVPQPFPAPGGHPTIAGIPASRQRSRSAFISGIEPAIAGTSAWPSSSVLGDGGGQGVHGLTVRQVPVPGRVKKFWFWTAIEG